MSASDTRISPTADYTSYVWVQAGLSESAFATRRGFVLYNLLRPMNRGAHLIGWPSLDDLLLARHRAIDQLLSRAIEEGRVGQVLEVAAGLSPRGRGFSARFADRGLIYVEGELPHMAQKKAELLKRLPKKIGDHHVVSLNALSADDPISICEKYFDRSRGLAVVTEGLLPYLRTEKVHEMWYRFSDLLSGFSDGVYLSDLHVENEMRGLRGSKTFTVVLGVFTRGRIYTHFNSATDAESALQQAGFSRASVQDAAILLEGTQTEVAPGVVRVIEAWR